MVLAAVVGDGVVEGYEVGGERWLEGGSLLGATTCWMPAKS